MRSLLLAASLLAAGSAGAAAAPADWRQAKLTPPMEDALRGEGYELKEDGRVLAPGTRAPLSPPQLAIALKRLSWASQRLALERLRLILDRRRPGPADPAAIAALKGDLPRDVSDAIDRGAGASDLRALAERDLAQVAAYFDGSRTMAERVRAALPVRAAAAGERASLPYLDPAERRLGDALGAAAARAIGRDPFGRAVLARLRGAAGRPALPPIVVEDLTGEAARYDYRRRALVVDRQSLMSAVADGTPAPARGALEGTLASRTALIDYLNAHPRAVADFAAKNDALLVHELTHVWQDRREPVMREMARGNLPQAVLLDYEEEAWTAKNLYLRSKLERAPKSVADDGELADYRRMMTDPKGWRAELRAEYAGAAANAMDLRMTRAIQDDRLEAARRRPVASPRRQAAQALDLVALERADKELARAQAAEAERLARLDRDVDQARPGNASVLASYYLGAARRAANPTERAVRLQKAEFYAGKSGDAGLAAKVRAEKEKAP